jgi:hypothetical protein
LSLPAAVGLRRIVGLALQPAPAVLGTPPKNREPAWGERRRDVERAAFAGWRFDSNVRLDFSQSSIVVGRM